MQKIIDSDVDIELKKEAMEFLRPHLDITAEIPQKKYPEFLSGIGNISQPIAKYLRNYYANGGGIPNKNLAEVDRSSFRSFLVESGKILPDESKQDSIFITIRSERMETEREMEDLFKNIKAKIRKS